MAKDTCVACGYPSLRGRAGLDVDSLLERNLNQAAAEVVQKMQKEVPLVLAIRLL